MLFNIIFKNESYVKAQVQIVQNIQTWFPMKKQQVGEKNLIKENTKGKNFKEGHTSRNYRILLFFPMLQRQTHARTKGIWHSPFPQEEKDWQSETLITKHLLLS